MTVSLSSVLVFILGAIFGSFLNVCIYRIPAGVSIMWPPSFCPECRKPINFHDNIPLLSFLILGGKCRECRAVIPWRYFLIELVSALAWLGLWLVYGLSGSFVAGVIFLSLLLVVSAIDFKTGFIPDAVTFTGMILGLALSGIYPSLLSETLWYQGLIQSALGLLSGGVLLLVVGRLAEWIFRKESMGGGDIKLLAMIGAFLGWQEAILVFFLAPFFALPFALFVRFAKKEETIHYGPFLALAAGTAFFFGKIFFRLFLR